jgi:hypothetical protein
MKTNCARSIEVYLPPGARRNRRRLGDYTWMMAAGGLAILCVVFSSGCSTGKSNSASFASVVITNQSVERIQQTTALVFEEAGYRASRGKGGPLVFEKEGSRGDQFAYGGLGGAAYGGAVTVRVKAEIVDLVGQDARRLQCTAYMVNDAGGGVFEDQQRLANFRRAPYQKLLDEVAGRLK